MLDIPSQSNDDAAAKGRPEGQYLQIFWSWSGLTISVLLFLYHSGPCFLCRGLLQLQCPSRSQNYHKSRRPLTYQARWVFLEMQASCMTAQLCCGIMLRCYYGVQTLTMLLALKFIAWLVEMGGLLSLHKSCKDGFHPSLDFYHYAQLPQANSCGKILRYLHWATWLQLPLVLGLFSALLGWFGGSRVTLSRFRMAFIGLLAVACALEMWAANVVLNLADSDAALFLSSTETTRAKIALCGYCISAAFNALIIIALGDDGEMAQYAGAEAGMGVNEPLEPHLTHA